MGGHGKGTFLHFDYAVDYEELHYNKVKHMYACKSEPVLHILLMLTSYGGKLTGLFFSMTLLVTL